MKKSMSIVVDSGNKTYAEPSVRHLVVGWLVSYRLYPTIQRAVEQGRALMLEHLQQHFTEFQWYMPVVQRFKSLRSDYEEPVLLLDDGVQERDIQLWDYALVITQANLRSYYKPYALAVPSRAVAVAVISTSRLIPQYAEAVRSEDEQVLLLAKRICALGLHLFGDPQSFMYAPGASDDLDRMVAFSPSEQDDLQRELADVADLRLEEQPEIVRSGALFFYLRAMWINAGDIVSAVVQAKPWEFPFRLSRLTTAAMSALLILLITAEAWDLGMSQPPWVVAQLSLFALTVTSLFILKRQRLLLRRGGRRLTEQTVVTNVTISAVVLLGMTTTYLLLFLLTLGLSLLLFSRQLIAAWAVLLNGHVEVQHYLVFAAFVASLGIVIGALGASFELSSYFRHITYVDEET
jgi:hypothetical protein